jgi:hypothetical protein
MAENWVETGFTCKDCNQNTLKVLTNYDRIESRVVMEHGKKRTEECLAYRCFSEQCMEGDNKNWHQKCASCRDIFNQEDSRICESCRFLICDSCEDEIRSTRNCSVCNINLCTGCQSMRAYITKGRTVYYLCSSEKDDGNRYTRCLRPTLRGTQCKVNTHSMRRFCKRHRKRVYRRKRK